jgi:diaminopimelate decarboxylase
VSWKARARAAAKLGMGLAARSFAPKRVDLPLALFDLHRDAGQQLHLREHLLRDVMAAYGSPLFLVDALKIERNAAEFLRVPSGASAGVECFVSYKTNPVPGVLDRLHQHGVGAECISEYEFWLARRLGVPGERIVLNGPGRSPAVMRAAIEQGSLICLNHREEIAGVAAIARELGRRARVGMRVVTDGGWGGQFGEPLASGAALRAYRELAQHRELAIEVLHVHLGGEIDSAAQVERLANQLVDFAVQLRATLGCTLPIFDAGGSLASATVARYDERALRLNRTFRADLCPRDPSTVLSIERYVETLVTTIERACQAHAYPRPRIFVEPGRALTSNAQLLLCTVTSLKESGAEPLVQAILDAGINIAEPVRNEYHQIFVLDAAVSGEHAYRLVGPICTPMDTLAWAWRLPELRPGAQLAILDAGAYFVPFSTSFSFPQPAIAIIDGSSHQLLRRAETFEDMVDRDA